MSGPALTLLVALGAFTFAALVTAAAVCRFLARRFR